ncbi:hypothetical protein KCP70_23000 [Salmonella enterica subsp. enterica]|nr:hypothetical protein KCP70_23000 [Salmonella enterica subsp. enterica]
MKRIRLRLRGQAWRAGKWLLETAGETGKRRAVLQVARDAIARRVISLIWITTLCWCARLGDAVCRIRVTELPWMRLIHLISDGDTMSIMGSNGKFVKYEIGSISGNVVTLKTTPAWVRDGTVFIYLPVTRFYQTIIPHRLALRDR